MGKTKNKKQKNIVSKGKAEHQVKIALEASSRGATSEAKEAFLKAREIYQAMDDKAEEGRCLHRVGEISFDCGELDTALQTLKEARTLRLDAKDSVGVADSAYLLAVILMKLKDFDTARSYSEEALLVRRDVQDMKGVAASLLLIASSYMEAGLYDEAIEIFRETIHAMKELRNFYGASLVCSNLSYIAEKCGRVLSAFKFMAARAAFLNQVKHPDGLEALLHLKRLAGAASLPQQKFQEVIEASVKSFMADDGEALLQEAFGGETLNSTGITVGEY